MPSFTDQLNRVISLDEYSPRRIISLVPSQTELLYDLGLDEEVAGITKFCVHPEHWFLNKPKVGGTKQVKKNIIDNIKPGLIIANKEENVKEQIEELARHYPVWVSDIKTWDDAIDMIQSVGEITGKNQRAKEIAEAIDLTFKNCKEEINKLSNQRSAAYLIWRKPYMAAGRDTFINEMMNYCGLKNIFSGDDARYPEITIELLHKKSCELLLLSSEPFPFSQKHIDEMQPHLPNTKILLADGEMFSWYGSRLLHAPSYFIKLLQEIK